MRSRLDAEHPVALLRRASGEVWFCGLVGQETQIRGFVEGRGVSPPRIHSDSFGSRALDSQFAVARSPVCAPDDLGPPSVAIRSVAHAGFLRARRGRRSLDATRVSPQRWIDAAESGKVETEHDTALGT